MNRRNLDERQERILSEALAFAAVVGFIANIFIIIGKYTFLNERDSVGYDIVLLVAMSLAILVYLLVKKEFDIPTTITGKVLPTSYSKEDKIARIKHYVKNAFSTAAMFLIFDITIRKEILIPSLLGSKALAYIADFLFSFTIFFLLNYFWHEHNVKKYNEYCKSLEDDDAN